MFVIIFSCSAFAQLKIGAGTGLNISNLVIRWDKNSPKIKGDAVSRINSEIFAEIPLDEQLFLYTGIAYSGKGANLFKTVDSNKQDSLRTRLNYLAVPLQLLYEIPSESKFRFRTSGGLYAGYGFNGSMKWKHGIPESEYHLHRGNEKRYRRLDLGYQFNVSVVYQYKAGLQFGYSRSLLNTDHPATIQKNRVMSIGFFFYLF